MKVLVFCEFSGVVLEAFAEGHDAYSADLLPTESEHKDRHFQGDGRWLLREPWDLVIAHPPCTYFLPSSGQDACHWVFRPFACSQPVAGNSSPALLRRLMPTALWWHGKPE